MNALRTLPLLALLASCNSLLDLEEAHVDPSLTSGGSGGSNAAAGSPAQGGSPSAAGDGGAPPVEQTLCEQYCTAITDGCKGDRTQYTDIDACLLTCPAFSEGEPGAVVRGDGEVDAQDPFNGYKFERDGRHASVLLNVATDPCIGAQFAHLLAPAKAVDLEHLAQCLSLFVQDAAGCNVDYATARDSAGEQCKSMKLVHTGLGITEEDYTALVMDAATALIAAGVPADSPQFMAVAGALTSDELKADVIESSDADYSQPSAMCVGAGGAGDGGAGGAAAGGAGAP